MIVFLILDTTGQELKEWGICTSSFYIKNDVRKESKASAISWAFRRTLVFFEIVS